MRSVPVVSLLLAVTLLLAPRPAWATRYAPFQDMEVSSGNGRYKLEIKAPVDAEGKRRHYSGRFHCTFHDLEAKQVLWERVHIEERRGTPVEALVHDDGWVMIRARFYRVVVLESLTGNELLNFAILQQLSEEDMLEHVTRDFGTTFIKDPMRWSFLRHDGRMFFVIRLGGGRWIIADLARGEIIREPVEALLDACEADDRHFAITTLDGAHERLVASGPKDVDLRRNVSLAVHIAGEMKIQECVAALRELAPDRIAELRSRSLSLEERRQLIQTRRRWRSIREKAEHALELIEGPGRRNVARRAMYRPRPTPRAASTDR